MNGDVISFDSDHFPYNDLVPVKGKAAVVPSQKLKINVAVRQIFQLRLLPKA